MAVCTREFGLRLSLSLGSRAREIAPREQTRVFISYFIDWAFHGRNANDPGNQDSVLNMPAN